MEDRFYAPRLSVKASVCEEERRSPVVVGDLSCEADILPDPGGVANNGDGGKRERAGGEGGL